MTHILSDPASNIAHERDATRNFVDLLRREQHALQHADVALLLPLAAEKAQRAQELAELAETRNCWLSAQNQPGNRGEAGQGVRDDPGTADAWNELCQLAQTADELNTINGILIGQRLRYIHQRLSVLQTSGLASNTSLYGSDGHPALFSGGRILGEV